MRSYVNRVVTEKSSPNYDKKPEKPDFVRWLLNDRLWINIVSEIETSHEWMLAEHTVEKGFNISDHKKRLPFIVTLNCVFLETKNELKTAEEKYQELLLLADSDEKVTLQTHRRFYDSMLIKSIRVIENSRAKNAIEFSLTLKEFREAKTDQSILDKDIPRKLKKKTNKDALRKKIKQKRLGKQGNFNKSERQQQLAALGF